MTAAVQTNRDDWELADDRGLSQTPIIETDAANTAQTPGRLAQQQNNIFATVHPQFVANTFQTDRAAGNDPSYATIGRWLLPGGWTCMTNAHDGSTTNRGEIEWAVYASVAGGDSTTIRLTNDNTGDVQTEAGLTGASKAWHDAATTVTMDDRVGQVNPVHLEAMATTGSNVAVESVEMRFRNDWATLPQTPYACAFRPRDVAIHQTEGNPLSTQAMRQMAVNAIDLKRRRDTGMILATWHATAVDTQVAGKGSVSEAVARQTEYRRVIRGGVWFSAFSGSGTAMFTITVTGTPVTISDSRSAHIIAAWTEFALEVPVLDGGLDDRDLLVKVEVDEGEMNGACAWWDPSYEVAP